METYEDSKNFEDITISSKHFKCPNCHSTKLNLTKIGDDIKCTCKSCRGSFYSNYTCPTCLNSKINFTYEQDKIKLVCKTCLDYIYIDDGETDTHQKQNDNSNANNAQVIFFDLNNTDKTYTISQQLHNCPFCGEKHLDVLQVGDKIKHTCSGCGDSFYTNYTCPLCGNPRSDKLATQTIDDKIKFTCKSCRNSFYINKQ